MAKPDIESRFFVTRFLGHIVTLGFLTNLYNCCERFCLPTLKTTSEALDVKAQILLRLLSFFLHPNFNTVDTQ